MRRLCWGKGLTLFVMLVLASFGAQAQTASTVPASQQQIALSYAPVVKRAVPAVVNIYTRKVVRQRVVSPFFDDPFFEQFFGGMPQGMTRKRMESSLGSGVIVRPSGLIVTNNHVISGADEITVVLADRREFEAKLLASDEHTDLAVLRIEVKGEALPYLELKNADEAQVGDLVLAIGNPFGVGQTVTHGIISALARTSLSINDIDYFIQTDAPINPGNSGGALVTMDGKLVGINSAIFSRSGGSMGLGFAIPSNMVRTVIQAVETGHKQIVRPWTGIQGQDVTREVAASLNLPTPSGVLINALHPSSPARKAGIKRGDVIVGVNGNPVEDVSAFRYRIATLALGDQASLEIVRAGKRQTVAFQLIAPPEDPPRHETKIKGNSPLSGAVIANLSPAVIEETGAHDVDHGVIVVNLGDQTPAASVGLQKGDVVLRINGAAISSVDDVLSALDGRDKGRWRIELRRGDNVLTLMVRG